MKDYHYLIICVMLIVLIYKWMQRSVKKEQDTDLFDSRAKYIETMIMNSDRNSRFAACAADDLIEELERKSFCKATHQQVNQLKILWRSKFAHLYPSHHK